MIIRACILCVRVCVCVCRARDKVAPPIPVKV